MLIEEHASRILASVERSMLNARYVIERYFSKRPELRSLRRVVTSLVFGTIRNYILLDRVARALGVEGPTWNKRVILFEAMFRDLSMERVKEAAVRLNVRGPIHKARDVDPNDVLPSNPTEMLSVKYSIPRWIVEYSLKWVPDPVKFLGSLNKKPPMWLRSRVDPDKLVRELERHGVEVQVDREIPYALRVVRGNPVNTPLFKEGKFYIMDKASQAVVYELGHLNAFLLIDVASAPGGKAIHAADLGARVVGIDISFRRLREEKALVSLYGADIDLALADSRSIPVRRSSAKFLVDPDCTSLGKIAHSPEIRLWVRPHHIRKMVKLQRDLLRAAANVAERGAEIVYSTCTITYEENERNAEWASQELGLEPVNTRVGLRTTLGSRMYPHIHGTEGFYIVKFMKV